MGYCAPWPIIKELVTLICYTVLGAMGIKVIICLISEVFCKHCRHCGKKAG